MTEAEIDAIARQELAQEMGGQQFQMPQAPSFDPAEIDRIARMELQQEMQQQQPQQRGPLSPRERMAGMFGAIGQGATFGLADEAAAGIRAFIGGIQGASGFNPSYQGYDAELAAIRQGQQEFANERPVADVVGQIGSSLVMPGGALKKGAGVVANATRAALTGGALGAAYGFGTGEGGFENRVENAKDVGTTSAIVSPVLAGAGQIVSKGLAKTGDGFERMALNIQRSDLQKADKFARPAKGQQPRLIQALEGAKDRGLLKGPRNAEALVERNENLRRTLSKEVSDILKEADANQNGRRIFPSFSNAQAYIDDKPAAARALREQLKMRIDDFNREWDGTVSGISKHKSSMYDISYDSQGNVSKQFDRIIAKDLKEAVEQQAETFGSKELAQKVKSLNAKVGEHLTLKDLLQKGVYNENMPDGLAKALRRMVVSPMGGSAVGLGLTAMSGNPLPAALGIAGAALATKTGQFASAGMARGASAAVDNASRFGARITPVVASRSSHSGASEGKTKPQSPLLPTQQEESYRRENTTDQSLARALRNMQPIQQREQSRLPETSRNGKALPYSDPLSAALSQLNTNVPKNTGKLKKERVDALFEALIQQESGGRADAVSPKGAKGLTQLMDETGKEYHKRLGIKEPYKPFDKQQNAKIGRAFLDDLVAKYDDEKLALAAFNVGETKLDAAIRKAGSKQWEVVYRFLPVETRQYVPSLLRRVA